MRCVDGAKIGLIFLLLVVSACQGEATIVIKDKIPWYFPAVLHIEQGQTVTWDNSYEVVVHPVSTLSGPEDISSGHFTKTWEYTFTKPGIYHYFCPVHPYMQGLIGVGFRVPKEMIPSWIQKWPPKVLSPPLGKPPIAGEGEIWLNAQFERVKGKKRSGAIHVINAESWSIKKSITDQRINNPHNLWRGVNKDHMLQTNWFDNYLSVIDKKSGEILRQVYVGESPAHVMTENNTIYVTVQGTDSMVILDGLTYQRIESLKTIEGEHGHDDGEERREKGRGPHGHMINKDQRMAVAHTEGGSVSVWDLNSKKKLFSHSTDPLPLMAGVSLDGTRAWTASFLTGKFSVFDVDDGELFKEFIIGKGPVQPVLSPDGRYILVTLSGDGAVAVVDAETFDLKTTLHSGSGAHGIAFGPKKGGGWYAYISNKFAPWVTVIDLQTLTVAGMIPLPKEALGGQGIFVVFDEGETRA